MAHTLAWLLLALGLAHIVFGLVRFKAPLLAACREGFVGRFAVTEERRTAFWFMVCGPLMMLAGQAALHAMARGDLVLLKMIGAYTLATSLLGVAAFPKSPFLASLALSVPLLAVGFGWL